MARKHNFSAGPGVLPEPVLRKAQQDIWEYGESGLGILECSHRSKLFDGVVTDAVDRLTRLLNLDDDQAVLFLQGGARTQFYQWPMNILRGGRAAYLDTGSWSSYALADAKRYGTVDVPFSGKETGYDRVPEAGEWGELHGDTLYLHYTSNNTIMGSEYGYVPDPGKALLACDMSSNFLSRPVDGSKFDFLYAGAQKNVGPSGVTVVVVRKSLVDRMDPDLPGMLRYGKQIEKGSMLNTPPTFAIYMIRNVLQWIDELGGLEAIEARNVAQAGKVYGVVDGSDFWSCPVRTSSRSRMNVRFTTGSAETDATFVKEADAAGLSGLKGHRSVGGLRASLYNAQTDAAVDALVDFMRDFERRRG